MTFVAGILLASLLGSVHCAAMCGAFVCAYTGHQGDRAPGAPGAARGSAHIAYHAGRLVSYTLLGVFAGAFGAGVERAGAIVGLGRAAAIVSGTLMIVWAASTIGAAFGLRASIPAPEWPRRALGGLLRRARDASAIQRAGAMGLLTTLLPCGWLYAFVATAAGTGSPLAGAGVMAVFWIGTVPMLAAIGFGAQRVFGSFAKRLPVASAVLVFVLGVLAIVGKMQPPSPASMQHHQHVAQRDDH